jgi:2-polyprenyl-6-methoxyphenol hydroxylase-like FAD-dependent oxidoreductase
VSRRCDGLHSAVRDAAGIAFAGAESEARWAVFDATIEAWQDDYDVVFRPHRRPPLSA